MRSRRASIDALLLLMVLLWGANYSVVKVVLREMPPQVFNGVRLIVASALFLAAIGARGWPALARRDLWIIGALGIVGHFIYQICFIGGLARTIVANSSLIIGCTTVGVMLLTASIGQERIRPAHAAGIALSVAGVYFVVAYGTGAARAEGATLAGDLLTIGAVICWSIYTVGARSVLSRQSPLVVTGLSMAFGTVAYAGVAAPALASMPWERVSAWSWVATVGSAALALCVAYLIWYTAVREIGNTRTSVYSNMVPVVAMLTAVLWLGEPLSAPKAFGAALVLGGVGLTRLGRHTGPPAEE
jgi:drug/metabolite transporter (DMT)-like permease